MLATLIGFIGKEISQTFRDPRMRMAMFYIPLFQMIIYGVALSTYTRNVRLAVVASPSDAFTRRLSQRMYASGWFVPVEPASGDPSDWIASRQAEVVLLAPPEGAMRDLGRGGAPFQLLIDSVDAVRARSIEGYVQTILGRALRDEYRVEAADRFRFSVRTFFNPERQTSIFLIPGTICVLLFLAIAPLTSMSMGRERELGTIETLLAAPISPWEVLLGKTIPFVVIGMIELPFGLLFARLLHVPMRGSLWLMMAATLIFLCCAVCGGFWLSMHVRNQQQAVFASFMFNFPAVQLSGIIFPVANMPRVIAWFAYLNPLYYYVETMRHLMLKGNDLAVIAPQLMAMGSLLAIAAVAVVSTFRQTLN